MGNPSQLKLYQSLQRRACMRQARDSQAENERSSSTSACLPNQNASWVTQASPLGRQGGAGIAMPICSKMLVVFSQLLLDIASD